MVNWSGSFCRETAKAISAFGEIEISVWEAFVEESKAISAATALLWGMADHKAGIMLANNPFGLPAHLRYHVVREPHMARLGEAWEKGWSLSDRPVKRSC